MKAIVVTLLTSLSLGTMAQNPFNLEHYLEEKVRNREVRSYLEHHIDAYNTAIQNGDEYTPSGPTIESFVEANNIDLGMEKRSLHNFSVPGGAEPHIAINPNDPNHVVVTYMSSADADYPIFVSMDAGDTWTPSSFSSLAYLDTLHPGTLVLGGGDPILAFDADGNLHLTYIYVHGTGFSFTGGMYYANSTDGGLTFDIPANGAHVVHEGDMLQSDLIDRQWMHCDITGSAFDGTLYMSAVYFGGTFGSAGELVLRKLPTDDGFTSYAVGVPHAGSNTTQFGNIKVDNNGTVHMACMEIDGNGDGNVVYTQSTDNGTTFSTPLTIATATTALPNSGNHLIHGRDNSATSMAVDGNNVFIAWTDMANNTVRAFMAYSTDGGSMFTSPMEFGRDLFGNGNYDLMPNLAADGGNATITWYHMDSVDLQADYVMAEFETASASFEGYKIISTTQTDFMNENGQDFYGDYNASEKDGCTSYSIFSDGSLGAPSVYFARENACILGDFEIQSLNQGIQLDIISANPAMDNLQVTYNAKRAQNGTLQIIDNAGKLVINQSIRLMTSSTSQHLSITNLEAGIYSIRITGEQEYVVKSFVKN